MHIYDLCNIKKIKIHTGTHAQLQPEGHLYYSIHIILCVTVTLCVPVCVCGSAITHVLLTPAALIPPSIQAAAVAPLPHALPSTQARRGRGITEYVSPHTA